MQGRDGSLPPRRRKKKDPRELAGGQLISKYQKKLLNEEAAPKQRIGDPENRREGFHDMPASEASVENQEEQRHPDYRTEACLEEFRCANCGRLIQPCGAGSKHRNHCPHCLHSLHVDHEPGDRASDCHGDMEPIAVFVRDDGEWALIHRCRKCGKLSSNRVLADDNPIALMSLAVRPLANPPFPLRYLSDYLEDLKKDL